MALAVWYRPRAMPMTGCSRQLEGVMMKVVVEAGKCQGHLRCVLYAPGVFEVDDLGCAFVSLETVPQGQQDAVRLAEVNCPEGAISIAG
jgi:ferredoxin